MSWTLEEQVSSKMILFRMRAEKHGLLQAQTSNCKTRVASTKFKRWTNSESPLPWVQTTTRNTRIKKMNTRRTTNTTRSKIEKRSRSKLINTSHSHLLDSLNLVIKYPLKQLFTRRVKILNNKNIMLKRLQHLCLSRSKIKPRIRLEKLSTPLYRKRKVSNLTTIKDLDKLQFER